MRVLLVVLSFFSLVYGEESCDDGLFCNGISVRLSNGSCTVPINPCDDLDDSTEDSCTEATQRCTHKLKRPDGECKQTCFANCTGKVCGEDGCGGFCGTCADGTGCKEGECIAGAQEGSCKAPKSLTSTIKLSSNERLDIDFSDDTSDAVHVLTPTCNYLTAAPEYIYSFEIAQDSVEVGFDIRTVAEHDTVLEVMEDSCSSANSIGCADDSTPPGNFGSRVTGIAKPGKKYYVMVDGFSSLDYGVFTLTGSFVANCVPKCDGNFCGDDQCGGSCGSCAVGDKCGNDLRCYPDPCTPTCTDRACGEDGCGGLCGTCKEGELCVGAKLSDDDSDANPSSCKVFEKCDPQAPKCASCKANEFCGTDCECREDLKLVPDIVVLGENLRDEMYIQDVFFPNSSCALVEGCVGKPGLRRLLRFTSTALNQGTGDFAPPPPKTRPDLFEYGQCHQHYHYKNFATYRVLDAEGKTLVMLGKKYAYCMEDTGRYLDGEFTVNCNKAYDCGTQGIQKGWVDSYQWGLDCSWVDITDLTPSTYQLEVHMNPDKVFQELSFDNNKATVKVTIPSDLGAVGSVTVAQKLQVEEVVPTAPPSSQPPSSQPPSTKQPSSGQRFVHAASLLLVILGAAVAVN